MGTLQFQQGLQYDHNNIHTCIVLNTTYSIAVHKGDIVYCTVFFDHETSYNIIHHLHVEGRIQHFHGWSAGKFTFPYFQNPDIVLYYTVYCSILKGTFCLEISETENNIFRILFLCTKQSPDRLQYTLASLAS